MTMPTVDMPTKIQQTIEQIDTALAQKAPGVYATETRMGYNHSRTIDVHPVGDDAVSITVEVVELRDNRGNGRKLVGVRVSPRKYGRQGRRFRENQQHGLNIPGIVKAIIEEANAYRAARHQQAAYEAIRVRSEAKEAALKAALNLTWPHNLEQTYTGAESYRLKLDIPADKVEAVVTAIRALGIDL